MAESLDAREARTERVWLSKRALAPIGVLILGLGLAALVLATSSEIERQQPMSTAPLVRVLDVEPATVRMRVSTHGTVVPRTESALIPEVAGRVEWVSPSLVSGGFFAVGDPLLKIEKLDYELALEQARARLARAQSDLSNARTAHARQIDLAKQQAASEAARDDAINRLRVAEAAKREAVAALAKAERDLARTEVLAPYDGRVRAEQIDVGQFVNRGASVATIYAVDVAEVRLPIQDEELAFLELPLAGALSVEESSATVSLKARFAGRDHVWQGEVVRTEGELDPKTRMVNVVAQVRDPYLTSNGRPPLSVGLFVEAEIAGAEVENVVVLPREALRGESSVLVVDRDEKLRFREVDVLRVSRDQVFVRGGLAAGERVCVSSLDTPIDGMAVRVRSDAASVAATPTAEAAS